MNVRHRRAFAALLLALFGASAAPTAHAGTSICVTTTAQFDAALKQWVNSSADVVTVKLQQHTYTLPVGIGSYSGYGGGGASLRLLGGYYSANGDPCGKRTLYAPNTTLQGDPTDTDSSMLVSGYGPEMTVEGITFKSFGNFIDFSADGGTTTLSEIIVTNVHSPYWPALFVTPNGGASMTLQNSLIYGNFGPGGVYAGDDIANGSSQIFLINNTITQNQGIGVMVGSASETTDAQVYGFNNIIFGNAGTDLRTTYANNLATFYYTIVGTTAGSIGTAGTLFSHADPKFNNPNASPPDFTLQAISPGINVGAPDWEVGGYTNTDLGGGVRVIGSAIDLGAYESIVNDLVPQVVTKTVDDTSLGTLRTAINTANGNANATTIKFNISPGGTCPQVIHLSTPLPDISSDITIDAYSEPGALVNADPSGYDGNICVIVRGGGSVDHALRTSGSGRLTVKGIEFEGFATAAVRLATGSNHQVVGNGFSALPGSVANTNGVLIEGTAKNSVVGWTDPPEHNVFDQAGSSAAIEIISNGTAGGHMIEGNYIGFNFDGSNWSGTQNLYGIYVLASGGNKIESNYIGNSLDNGIRLTGTNTTNNVLTYNTIGRAPFSGNAAGNGSSGIAIAASAHGNRIGSAPGSSYGGQNLITNNAGPGVWIESTAGAGNRVTGDNQIYDNSGLLAIDLGGLGATADDNGDVDTGANNLQNYPFLSQATRIESGTIRLGGFLQTQVPGPAQTYRLDLYWTDSCVNGDPSGARGELKRFVGFLNLYTDGSTFLDPFSNIDIAANRYIPGNCAPGTCYLFAIATDAAGNTSEPGPCHTFIDDYIFSDGFGP